MIKMSTYAYYRLEEKFTRLNLLQECKTQTKKSGYIKNKLYLVHIESFLADFLSLEHLEILKRKEVSMEETQEL